jgi:hypothetical protein
MGVGAVFRDMLQICWLVVQLPGATTTAGTG